MPTRRILQKNAPHTASPTSRMLNITVTMMAHTLIPLASVDSIEANAVGEEVFVGSGIDYIN